MSRTEQKLILLLVIVGPTASGKSDLAVSLAKKLGGEVISADSRQVYKGLDIGTGKITKKEMRGIRHHLLDVADPRQRFDADRYRTLARKAIADIHFRDKLPILVGGTGLYVDAVLSEYPFPNVPPDMRLRTKFEKKSPEALLKILKKIDPVRACRILENNSEKKNARRIVRAIEIATFERKLGKRWVRGQTRNSSHGRYETVPSAGVANLPPSRPLYAPFFIGVKRDPEDLKRRIRRRLEVRLRHGMIVEARNLHAKGLSYRRMESLGLEYRYLARHLQGKIGKAELIEKLNMEIWRYAKRQMTWFKKNKEIRWIKPVHKKIATEQTIAILRKINV